MPRRDVKPDRTVEHLKPNDYGALILKYDHLDNLMPVQKEATIGPVLRDLLYEDRPAQQAALARLTQEKHAKAMQWMNTDSPITRAALIADDQKYLEDMARVSPHGYLQSMTTPVYLLHGEDDNVIPSAEA